MPVLKIRKFDPQQLKASQNIIMIAKKGTGMTTLTKNFFTRYEHELILCPLEDVSATL